MKNDFLKITVIYTAGVIAVLYLMWLLLSYALPEANLNIIQALSTVFGINLPEAVFFNVNMGLRAVAVIAIIAILSIGLIILNVFFGAVVTTHFIRPRVNLITSRRGVLSTRWSAARPYVLVRLSNFHKYEIADLKLTAVLTVQETRVTDAGDEEVQISLPVEDFTPRHVLVMQKRQPWSIAIPADIRLSSSMTKDYHFKPGEPILHAYTPGRKVKHVRRSLEILLQGVDTHSYASFILHRNIPVDEQAGDQYTLHLHKGAFKSLPLHIDDAGELEKYTD